MPISKWVAMYCFLLSSQYVWAQTMDYSLYRRYSPVQLQQDFLILQQSLLTTHPDVHNFIKPDSLESLGQDYVASITDSLTEDEFHILVRKYLVAVGCGHTMAKPSEEWYAFQTLHQQPLPFDIHLYQDKFYVKNYYQKDTLLSVGTEITAIDHRPIQDILHAMKAIQERDGYAASFVTSHVEKLFRTYYLFLYGSKPTYIITYLTPSNKMETITVNGIKPENAKAKITTDLNDSTLVLKTTAASFYIKTDYPQLGYLDIDRFQNKGYKKFYKTVFERISSDHISHLVIDLRGNGGGYFPHGNYLLKYLVDEPVLFKFHRPKSKPKKAPYLKMGFWNKTTKSLFKLMPDKDKSDPNRNYVIRYKPLKKHSYKCALYVLTDGGSFSMSSYVAAKLQHQTGAVLIGSETGGGEAGSNAILTYNLTLPETKIRVNLPYYVINHDVNPTQVGRGVMPDLPVAYSLQDKLNKRDLEMEKVYEFVRSGEVEE
ncbi:MAG: hypothetical protein KA479_09190 [Saprospiraceae bacterium]|nr:hypothetical protein [Saprospiraceae bacterium]